MHSIWQKIKGQSNIQLLFCNIDGQGTYWLEIKLDLRNVHWSNYTPLLYLCPLHNMLTVDYYIFELLYEVLVEQKNWKGPMQAPLWKNSFLFFF